MNKTEAEGFDEFWRAFPRRVGKQAALRMYKRALKLTTQTEILRAAKLYASERAGKEMEFTKHPATWLNAGCYSDYPAIQPAVTLSVGFYAAFTSAELDAWNAYGRATKGLNYPQDRRGGWFFPTRWPPGYEETQAA